MRNDFLAFFKSGFYLVVSISLTLLVLSVGCEEKVPDYIGRDLLPGSDDILVVFDSTEIIHSYTSLGDSVKTNEKTTQLLGSYVDPLFGRSTASIITQAEITGISPGFGTDAVADSVILTIYIADYYGNANDNHQITLYEFTDSLRYDTSYYSNFNPAGKYDPNPLGTGMLMTGDSLLTIEITSDELKNRLVTAADTVYKSNQMFQKMLPGFYIVTDDVANGGSILYSNFAHSQTNLTVYYHNSEDTSEYSLVLASNYAASVNIFSHDYTGSSLSGYLGNSDNDSLVFVQAMAGVRSNLRFPELEAWRDSIAISGPIAINNAELIVSPETNPAFDPGSENYPVGLNLLWIDDIGEYRYVFDQLLSPESFGGEYDKNQYLFNIKIHLQSYIDKKVENGVFMITAGNNPNTATQLVLKGGSHSSGNRMKLKITYTKL